MSGTITAIVPTYNRAGYLAEALDSLLAQSRPISQIIVWDDGSTDGTREVAESVARRAPVVEVHGGPNGGKSRALNAAMKHARGDYIWICDDDDLLRSRAAEQLAAPLDADPALGAVCGGYVRFFEDAETGARAYTDAGYWPDLREGTPLRHLLEDIFLFQNGTLTRRSVYEAVGPFREDLVRSIDYDMIVRIAARFPILVVEETVFEQRKHEGDRGPASARHAAGTVEEVWSEQDRLLFRQFRDNLPLRLYEAMFEGEDADLVRRAALIQRGAVYSRRNDWDAALEDFHDASKILPDAPLSEVEWATCRRAMAGKHGCDPVIRKPYLGEVVRLAKTGMVGAEIAAGLGRGATWRVREAVSGKALIRAGRLVLFVSAVSRPATVARRGLRMRKTPQLAERGALSGEDYGWT